MSIDAVKLLQSSDTFALDQRRANTSLSPISAQSPTGSPAATVPPDDHRTQPIIGSNERFWRWVYRSRGRGPVVGRKRRRTSATSSQSLSARHALLETSDGSDGWHCCRCLLGCHCCRYWMQRWCVHAYGPRSSRNRACTRISDPSAAHVTTSAEVSWCVRLTRSCSKAGSFPSAVSGWPGATLVNTNEYLPAEQTEPFSSVAPPRLRVSQSQTWSVQIRTTAPPRQPSCQPKPGLVDSEHSVQIMQFGATAHRHQSKPEAVGGLYARLWKRLRGRQCWRMYAVHPAFCPSTPLLAFRSVASPCPTPVNPLLR